MKSKSLMVLTLAAVFLGNVKVSAATEKQEVKSKSIDLSAHADTVKNFVVDHYQALSVSCVAAILAVYYREDLTNMVGALPGQAKETLNKLVSTFKFQSEEAKSILADIEAPNVDDVKDAVSDAVSRVVEEFEAAAVSDK